MNKQYIGDGVYVEQSPHEAGALILTTEDGITATNKIYIEPEVWEQLQTYYDKAFRETKI